MKGQPLVALIVLGLFALVPCAVGADGGEVWLGFRAVDVGGSENKYREDVNLEDGPRLFGLRLDLQPKGGAARFADRVDIDLSNLGGDPFQTMHIGVAKQGRFRLRFDRRESSYFYEDIILPLELSSPRLSDAGDFHHFDFERVHDTAELSLQLNPRAKLNVGFDRFTKRGESTTTLDIQRDEFELDRPIDESMNEYRASFEYAWDKVTLVLQETIRDFETRGELFLPGLSLGEDPEDATVLDFFFLEQPYDTTTVSHTARVVARPNSRLTLRTAATLQTLELDVEADERVQGLDFRGNPFASESSGEGEIDRDAEMLDVDLSYRINARLAAVGGVRYRNLDQEGDLSFGGSRNEGRWDIETTGVQVGLEASLSPALTLSGGVIWEERDAAHAAEEGIGSGESLELETETTEQTGLFAILGWRPNKHCRVSVEVEDTTIDDPFTLSSPTDRRRYRVSGRYGWETGWTVSGSYLGYRYENGDSGWEADRDQANLRFGYQRDGLSVSLGANTIQIDRSIDNVTNVGLFAIRYGVDADFFDGRVRWQAHERWLLGAEARLYENNGSFGLERTDWRGYVEYSFNEGYLARFGYRSMDYDEQAANFDDYDADIAEFALGLRW